MHCFTPPLPTSVAGQRSFLYLNNVSYQIRLQSSRSTKKGTYLAKALDGVTGLPAIDDRKRTPRGKRRQKERTEREEAIEKREQCNKDTLLFTLLLEKYPELPFLLSAHRKQIYNS